MDIQLNQRYTDRPKNNDTLCTDAPLIKVNAHDNYSPSQFLLATIKKKKCYRVSKNDLYRV